jgi:hypothetical protein
MDRSHAVTQSSSDGLTPCVRARIIPPVATGRVRDLLVKHRRTLMLELAMSVAASSIMALLVVLGGEAIERIPPGTAATSSDPDPERTRVATYALSLFMEANAPGSVSPPCWLSHPPNDIIAPCRP